ncbi:MAG TPA: hypothetical protein VFI42_00585 [Thermomicrobiaceae bacterium]|nr:hypothetical protein [Thermomicrobiaceae bacterium]
MMMQPAPTIVSEIAGIRTSTLHMVYRGHSFQVVIRADWSSLQSDYTLQLLELGPSGVSLPVHAAPRGGFASYAEAREAASAAIAAFVDAGAVPGD